MCRSYHRPSDRRNRKEADARATHFVGEGGIGSEEGGDFNWPGNTNTPLYMLNPNANLIKILDTNLDVDEVWP
jgi:hypothetical protein